ncbi:hypothetical protein BDB01DRAFT_784971 [Pilobolus umbonatus]|nr:hypothetical protein BDB01DRAFT_784971 [Pilobolus umbonatus]
MTSKVNNTVTEGKVEGAATDKSSGTPTIEDQSITAPTSPSYPPYGAYIDANGGYEITDPINFTTYVYPVGQQFSVQYYPDYSTGYQSYPGSPSLHPQSPPINPTSPPFSPTYQYQQTGIAMSPPPHGFMLPAHTAQPFPPLQISSPVLTGTSVPGSPPHQYLPGPYIISTDGRPGKRHYPPQHQLQQPNYRPEVPAEGGSPVYHSHNIYVRGLPSDMTDESFMEMCSAYGLVSSSKAILDQKTGECKGYGFAMFENENECENAIEGLNAAGFQASYARIGQESFSSRLKHLQDETSTNIYISNLPLDYTEQNLEELFHPYQTISNRILRDPQTGMSRGVGFARLSDRYASAAIIEKFNGLVIEGSSAPLQVRFADSPAQKKLKNQTTRRRMIRPREFQPMAGFSMRPMMPITPETMLGIAPVNSHFHYADQPQFPPQ